MIERRPYVSIQPLSLLFFIFPFLYSLYSIESLALAEHPLKIKHAIQLSNCPSLYITYRCFPDDNGNIDSKHSCDGVVPDDLRKCRRLGYFPAQSQIKVTSIHDREGNDITNNIGPCLEDPSQCFLGVVSKENDIAYTPLVNTYSKGGEGVALIDDIKTKLASLQEKIQEKRRQLGLNEKGQTREEARPAPIITSHSVSHNAEDCPCHDQHNLPNMVSELLNTIKTEGFEYDSCNKKNNYLENLLTRDSTATQKNFMEDFSPVCTYAALKASITGHRVCIGGKSYYRKTSPCLSEKYHKSVHNSLVLVSKCTEVDVKVLFDLFNTESSLHLNVRSESFASGPAQLTEILIKDVNNRLLSPFINEENEACRQINSYFSLENNMMSPKYTCDRLAPPPRSPLQNMLYGAIGFRDMKNQIISSYTTHTNLTQEEGEVPRFSEIYNKLDSETQKIVTEVAMYGYNHGITNIRSYFDEFIKNNKNISYSSFTGPNGKWVQFLIQKTKGKKSHRKEFLNYIYNVSDKFPGHSSNTTIKAKNMTEHLKKFEVPLSKCSHYY